MEFLLDSDSDSAYSPQPTRRTAKASGNSMTPSTQARSKTNEPDRTLHVSSRMSRAELMEAYRRLETPKAFSRVEVRPKAAAPLELPLLDSSRERMSIANFVDSDTNGEDSDSFLTMPINTSAPSDPTEKRSLRAFSLPSKSDKASDLELSGVSDAEELLAEFASGYYRRSGVGADVAADRFVKPIVEISPRHDPGRLLHLDSSNSEVATPPPQLRYRTIKDELDQSKTRFRQSINDLLQSSPISVPQVYSNPQCKLGENVIGEVEILENRSSFSSTFRESSPVPRKLTTNELLKFSPVPAEKSGVTLEADVAVDTQPIASVLLKRILWALFIATLLFTVDAIVNAAILRQSVGLPILDMSLLLPYQQVFVEYYEIIADGLSTSWQAIVPH